MFKRLRASIRDGFARAFPTVDPFMMVGPDPGQCAVSASAPPAPTPEAGALTGFAPYTPITVGSSTVRPAPTPDAGSDLVRRGDVLSICKESADTSVNYIFSDAEPDHDRRREAMEATATSIRHAVANLPAAAPSPSPHPAEDLAGQGEPVAWAVSRWRAEVENRPLRNAHRRTLDDTWRQVIRRFGGDPEALVGPTHDELVANSTDPAAKSLGPATMNSAPFFGSLAISYPAPIEADLADPQFNAIWDVIKSWDVNVEGAYTGYCGANGNHVMAVLNAVRKVGTTYQTPPHDPLYAAPAPSRSADREELRKLVWDTLELFRQELVETGGVTFGGLTNAVTDAILALRDAPRDGGDGWLPIETAPKDGTLIGVGGGCAIWNDNGGFWHTAVGRDYGRRIQWKVTHWKNLDPATIPPSPNAGDGTQDTQPGAVEHRSV